MTARGWTAIGLTGVEQDERLWTVAEAAQLLDEPSEDVRYVIRRQKIEPVGTRKKDGAERRGRQPRVYRAIDLIQAYDGLSRAA